MMRWPLGKSIIKSGRCNLPLLSRKALPEASLPGCARKFTPSCNPAFSSMVCNMVSPQSPCTLLLPRNAVASDFASSPIVRFCSAKRSILSRSDSREEVASV